MKYTDLQKGAAQVDCGYWATEANRIRLQKGHYSFVDREYLKEPMSSTFRRRAYMKSAQGGGSLAENLKSFHGMIHGYLPCGVLYLFPTDKDMQDYSKGVMGPIIAENYSIRKWIKTGKKASDSAGLKTIRKANLYMRGAGLGQIIEGEGESAALKGISVDKVVFDEIELMDPMAIAKAAGRMKNSQVKEEVYIGNPGIPGRGIDEIFSLSDRRHWFRKCGCGEWTCAELTFPDCVKIRADGTGYVGCMKCGKEVFVRDGQWVPQDRDKSDYMHGYRWSCLTSPNNDPAEILEDFINPPQGNLADVYRLSLGLPYVATENRLSMGQVYSRCGQSVMGLSDRGPCAFGLDVGKIKHLVIGKRIGRKNFQIIKVARFSDWDDISRMILKFNCKSGVIDARPYEDEARRFQKAHHLRIFLCEYSETTLVGTTWNPKTKMVKVNRTEILDATHNLVSEDGLLVLPRRSPEIQEFAKQLCDPAKKEEINKKTKQLIYRYIGKEDHYRHALNYFLMAAEKIGVSQRSGHRKKHKKVMNEYARI
ncbi:hypothetical protein LCGC14_0376920 [marine sediment metagenome]|uniref:Phage terminase large subunit GpA ATPase domain-containing protein n=1 Tax=marine sediment metagenome TaxID=412755 RepID=A0A0F9VQT3_9ZZZZ